jgi:hypothetical protein
VICVSVFDSNASKEYWYVIPALFLSNHFARKIGGFTGKYDCSKTIRSTLFELDQQQCDSMRKPIHC